MLTFANISGARENVDCRKAKGCGIVCFMKRLLKAQTFNIINYMTGGAALWHSSSVVRGLAQTGVEFCENCGKVLDRPDDITSVRRGDYCLECDLENKFGDIEDE